MSLAIYSLLQSPTGDVAAFRLILFSIVLSVLAIIASEWFARRLARKRG
jgi:molybdate transport system permease protein